MIQFVNISKTYKNDEIIAVHNINFTIEQGEFVFLIGPSGSGKTTIIKLLIREEDPTSGKIYFNDEDITAYNRKQIYQLRRKIGVIFQDFKLLDDKTAYENIAFVLEASGTQQKDIEETVPYVLDIVGLADRMDSFPQELSGGEKQRVAIARALANDPKVLIADEPTGNLDPDSAWDIIQILQKINGWGTTVIMSTHGSTIVDKLEKRVISLKNGSIVCDNLKGNYLFSTQKTKEGFEDKVQSTECTEELKKPHSVLSNMKKKDKATQQETKQPTTENKISSKEFLNEKTKIENTDKLSNTDKKESKIEEYEQQDKKTYLKNEKKVSEHPLKIKISQVQKLKPPINLPLESTTSAILNKDLSKPKPKLKISLVGKRRKGLVEKDSVQKETKVSEDKTEKKYNDQLLKISPQKETVTEKQQKPKESIDINNKTEKNKIKNDLKKLLLPTKVITILEKNGVTTIESLIQAGISTIEKIKDLDADDINNIRSAIATYIQNNL